MEHIHGRPPLGDIFCPPRQFLNDENEYLTKVGIIILINGAPSHQLPRQMAIEIANVHNTHPNDYLITQATISPYLVICRTKQDRDSVVRGGMYSISPAGVRFIVHEWRPRFGMGYDPPTHQAWVKIVGLPLQAWTMPEVTAVLQRFGHPVQILPFGRDAGHFRDITALIDTNHLSQIPLAYVYREGEYSSQVDIYILASRNWTPGYFPPPEDPIDPQGQQPQAQQPHRNDSQRTPVRHPSSSPSNDDPSEPTVDLSAWSPRSRCIQSACYQKWMPKAIQSRRNPEKRKDITLSLQTLSSSQAYILLVSASAIHIFSHNQAHTTATANPNEKRKNLPRTHSGTRVHLLSIPIPSHIDLNFSSPLRTTDPGSYTLDTARKNYKLPLTRSCRHDSLSKRAGAVNHSLSLTLLDECLSTPQYLPPSTRLQIKQNPKQSSPFILLSLCWASIHPPPKTQFSCPLLSPLERQHSSPKSFKPLTLLVLPTENSHNVPLLMDWPPKNNSEQNLELDQGPQSQPEQEKIKNNPFSPDGHNKEIALAQPEDMGPTHALTHSPAERKGKKGKEIHQPTRRSQRIQAKLRSPAPTPKKSDKARSKTTQLPFDRDSYDTPIDVSVTLAILQATGLTITKHIEQMVEQEAMKTKIAENNEESPPSTPLHDHIPPLHLPGLNLML